MSRYVKVSDRNRLSIEPFCLDDYITENADVRALEVILDYMNLSEINFKYSKTKVTGRRPYDPIDMFKIYAYSYFNGIRSSRKIERECGRNLELMWLVSGIKPDFKTIADFRKDNKQAIIESFRKFSSLCSELELVSKEVVAVDGSKFRASNSRSACHTEQKLNEKLEHHINVCNKYMELLDNNDFDEQESKTPSKSKIIKKLEEKKKRIKELELIKCDVIENGSIYETDPDSKYMRANNNGTDVCHNVQIAVENKNHLVVAVDVTSQAIDKEQLLNMSLQAKDSLGVETLTVLADKGYYSGKEFKLCYENGIVPIVSKATHRNSTDNSNYGKNNFTYNDKYGGYICPQGALLLPFKTRKTNTTGSIRYANFLACQDCEVKSDCTTSKKGRTIEDKAFSEYSRQVDKHTQENISLYKERQCLVEHPFGTVKRSLGFTHFLTRGNESVRAESAMHFLVYNLRRVMNILGKDKLICNL